MRLGLALVMIVIIVTAAIWVLRPNPGLQLINAAGSGDLQAVKSLLQQGAPINYRNTSMWGWTPLIMAIHIHQTECVRYLVEAGADVNLADSTGMTPLMCLAVNGDEAVPLVKLLIIHGANMNAKAKDGMTVFGYAEGDPPAPKLLRALESAEAEQRKSQEILGHSEGATRAATLP